MSRIFNKIYCLYLICIISLCSCALKPERWAPPKNNLLSDFTLLNNQLTKSEQIDLAGNYGPEDIVFDKKGNLYCGVHHQVNHFSKGQILQITPEGNIRVFFDTQSWVAGLHFDQYDNLIALSHKDGLISISPDKTVKILISSDSTGAPFLIPNGLDIASDGMIYFSNTSSVSPYSIPYGRKLIMEVKPQGALYAYDPKTTKISKLIDGTYFGNGVVLSKNEDFLLMTETSKYRVLRYWLKGKNKGKTEVFMDNLPGFPNGISIREDGSFWLGFSTKRNALLDKIHDKKMLKRFVYALPEFLQPKQEKFGMVYHISENGALLNALYDPTGKVIPEAGAVKEFDNKLYIGGDILPYIGVFDLSQI